MNFFEQELRRFTGKTTAFKSCKALYAGRACFIVEASNIGYTKPKERSQGKGGDLRSKYDLTLTVVRKQYNGRGLFGKACRTALDTLSCCAPVPAGFTT